jgi:hypothetical protein
MQSLTPCGFCDRGNLLSRTISFAAERTLEFVKEPCVGAEDVTFTNLKLPHNDTVLPGRPDFFFEFVQQRRANHTYCEAKKALKDEQGLDDYRTRFH